MAQVNYVLTDITYESSVNPNVKFNLVIRAYDAVDQTGDITDNRYFINGAVDGKDIMSDCLSAANQVQSAHCILRSESNRVISGNDYHLIEALAAACDAAATADVEETYKDENGDDIVIAQRFSKKPNDDTVMAEVYVNGAVVWRTSFKLNYTATAYGDGDISTNKISDTNKPDLAAEVLHAKESVLDGTTVRYLVTPDPISGVYTAGKISYKYTTNWDLRAEQNTQDRLWHAYVTFSLLYGTDDVSQEFRKRDFDFSKYNLYRAETAMQGVMDGLIDQLFDMFDKLSGVKFAVNTNGDPNKDYDWITQEVTVNEEKRQISYLRPDSCDQLVTAFSRPKGDKSLVLEAAAYAPNYDGTVRCLLQLTNGIVVDKTGAEWESEGSPVATLASAKFGYGLLLTNGARMKCSNVTLGGADITIDFFAYIPASSAAGRIFFWGNTSTFLELRYDNTTKNVVMSCKEGSVSSKQDDISYGAETVVDQNFHYAITYSFANKELILFVDGVKMGAVSNVTIGTFKDNAWQGIAAEVTLGELTTDFSVTLDEVRVSDGLNRWPVPKRDPGKIIDAAGGEWLVKASQKQDTTPTNPLDPNEPDGELTPVTDTRFGTGIEFSPYNYIYYNTPIMMGGPSSPDGDFTVDFFVTPTSTSHNIGGILELTVGSITNPSYSLGFHIPNKWCVHDSEQFLTKHCTPDQEVYCAIQYNADTQEVEFYFNGETYNKSKRRGLTTESEFHLVVGRYVQTGDKGYFKGKIDQLRIMKGKRLWNEDNAPRGRFTPPTAPYVLESEERDPADPTKFLYTKAFLTSAALTGGSSSSSARFKLARQQWSVKDSNGQVVNESSYKIVQPSQILPFQDNSYSVNGTVYKEINSIGIVLADGQALWFNQALDSIHDFTVDFQVLTTGKTEEESVDLHIDIWTSEDRLFSATIDTGSGRNFMHFWGRLAGIIEDVWNHVMLTYDNINHMFSWFVNGKLLGMASIEPSLSSYYFCIYPSLLTGRNPKNTCPIIIDEVRISKGIQRQEVANVLETYRAFLSSHPMITPPYELTNGSDHFEVPTKRYDWDDNTLTILRSSSLWTMGIVSGQGDVIFFVDSTSDTYGAFFKTQCAVTLSTFIADLRERQVNCRIGLAAYGYETSEFAPTWFKWYGITEDNAEFDSWLANMPLSTGGTAEPAFEAMDYVLDNVTDLSDSAIFVVVSDQDAVTTKAQKAAMIDRLKEKSIKVYYTNGGKDDDGRDITEYKGATYVWQEVMRETDGQYYNLNNLSDLIFDIGDSLLKNSAVEIPVMISSPVPESARVFKPPSEPYNAIVNEEEALGLKEFYVPLVPYFDDTNFTVVERLPRQAEPYPEYDGLVHRPVWLYYDESNAQLKISGTVSGINAQVYYAFFEPKAGYCWRDGSTTKKRVPWYIRKLGVGQMPRQDEPLVYNTREQDVNLVNFDSTTMVLSGRTKATFANTADVPYYYCTVTLKDDMAWPAGTTEPYEVPWAIVPQSVTLPVLSETSNLSFVYNGTEQGPVFVYDSSLISVTGDIRAVDANTTNAGILLTEEYCVTFSLKDKQNYRWNTEGTDLDISDVQDISFFWSIKRCVVAKPEFSGGPFVYSGEEQGPTVAGLSESCCQISGHRATEPGYYVARVVLVDPDNCEWDDETTGDVAYNWEIPMQKGQVTVAPSVLNLQAHKGTPVPSATVTVTRLGSGNITVTDNAKVRVEIENNIVTVYGLQNTGAAPVQLTVSVETGKGYDYEGVSATLTVNVLRWLDALSWKEIAELATEDELLNGYSFIGDSKAIPVNSTFGAGTWAGYKESFDFGDASATPFERALALSNNPAFRVVLVGVDHNAAYEGDGRAHFLFYNNGDSTLGYLSGGGKLAHSDTANYTGGWRNSNIRTRYRSFQQYDMDTSTLPDDMVRYTVPVLKWTDNIGNGVNDENNVFPTLEWLTSFSEKEVYGTNVYSNKGEDISQERYAYFALNPGDIKRDPYRGHDNAVLIALRSPNAVSTGKDIFADTNGVLTTLPLTGSLASDGRDSLLLFTMANKRQDNLTITTIDQHMVSLLHCVVENTNPLYVTDVCNGLYKFRPQRSEKQDLLEDVEAIKGEYGHYNYLSPTDEHLPFSDPLSNGLYARSLCCAGNYVVSEKPFVLNGSDITIDMFFGYANHYDDTNHNCDAFLFTLKSRNRAIRVYVKDNTLCCNLLDKYDTTTARTITLSSLVTTPVSYHHCALQCKDSKLYLYINGKGQKVTDNYSIQKGLYDFYLGADLMFMLDNNPNIDIRSSARNYYDFHVSEVRILDGIAAYSIPASDGTQTFTPLTTRFSETAYLAYDHSIEGVHLSLTSAEPTKVLNVTQHDGQLCVQSSNPRVVAAYVGHDSSLNCDTVTLEGISAGTATVTIYTKDTALTYGDIRTIEVTCDTSITFKTLANCQPSEIQSIVKKGNASTAWQTGDKTGDISLSGNVNGKQISQIVKATIIGFDHNKQKESNGQFSVHLMLDPVTDTFVMNDEDITTGGWKSSKMRTVTCADIYAALPAAWKSVVTPCTKYSDNSGVLDTDKAISSTEDNVWLLSNYEVTGTVISSGRTITAFESEQQKQYDYFKIADNRPSDTWLRTPEINGTTFVSQGAATKTVFCFMISDYSAAELLSDSLCSFTNNNFVECDGNVHYPEEDGIIRYLANAEHPTLYRQYYTFSGDISAQHPGTYTLRIKPAPGYLWDDGSATEVSVPWTILPADSTVTTSKDSLRAYCKNNFKDSVVLSRKATTALEVTGYDTTLISVAVSNNTVTITALATGLTDITITSPTNGDYKAVSVTLPVIASKVGELSSLTPAEIQAAVIAGYAPLAWDPGDVTAPITVSGMFAGQDISGFYRAFILSCKHNTRKEGKHLHLCLGKTREGDKTLAFSKISLGNTEGGWYSSALRTQVQSLISCFPKAWRDVITSCTKYSNTKVPGQSNKTKDKVWLLAQEEIFSYPNSDIKQYDYFAYGNQAIAYRQQYSNVVATLGTRTVSPSNLDSWVGVNTQGKETVIPATQKVALLPCFAIGTTKENPELSVSPESLTLKVDDVEDVTVTVISGISYTVTGYDDSIAEVSTIPPYTVSGISVGQTYLIVTTEETDVYAQDSVTVPITVTAKDKTDPIVTFSYSMLNIIKGTTAVLTVDVIGGDIFSVTTEDTTIAAVTQRGSYYSVAGVNTGSTYIVYDIRGDLSHNDIIKKVPVFVGNQAVTLITLTQAASNLTVNNPTYNGQEWNIKQNNIIAGYSQRYHELTGDITATNHSNVGYSVQVSPQLGFQWFDKTTETKTLSWNVNKATGILAGADIIVLTKTTGETVTETYTVTEGSTLSVKNNSHASLVTATISGSVVTFTSSCSSNVTANVTLQVSETNNYSAAELTVEVTVRDSALEVVPAIAGKDKLSVSKASVTYNKDTDYTVDSSWVNNYSNDYHRITKVARVEGNSETVISNKKIKDAGLYRIYVSPAAGCAWDVTNDIDPVRLEYTINRRAIAADEEPVQRTAFTLQTGSVQPVANNFTYDSAKCTFVRCSSQSTTGTFTGDNGAFFEPTSNYCWRDGSTAPKSFLWTISSLVLLTKPTITTTTFTYDGTEKDPGIVTPDGMASYVTVTMQQKSPVVYSSTNPYSDSNKTTTGFETEYGRTQTVAVYKQTDAGVYKFTFTINDIHTASWADSSTDPVSLEYTINRREIAAADEPAVTGDFPVAYYVATGDIFPTVQLQSPVFTTTTEANAGSDKKYTKGDISQQGSVGTYTAQFLVNSNYKWRKVNGIDNPFAPKEIPWKIVKADGFVTIDTVHNKNLTNLDYERGVVSQSSTITSVSAKQGSFKLINTDNKVSFQILQTGTTIISVTVAATDNFKETTVDLEFGLTLVKETEKTSLAFVHNLFNSLVWSRIADGAEALNTALDFATNGKISTLTILNTKILEQFSALHTELNTQYGSSYGYTSSTSVGNLERINKALNLLKTYFDITIDRTKIRNGQYAIWSGVEKDVGALLGKGYNPSAPDLSKNDVITEQGSLKSYPSPLTQTINGTTVIFPPENTNATDDSLEDKKNIAVRSFYTWWCEACLKYIKDALNISLDAPQVVQGTTDPIVLLDKDYNELATVPPFTYSANTVIFNFFTSESNGNTLTYAHCFAIHYPLNMYIKYKELSALSTPIYFCVGSTGFNANIYDARYVPIDLNIYYGIVVECNTVAIESSRKDSNEGLIILNDNPWDVFLLHEIMHGVTKLCIMSIDSSTTSVWFIEGIAELMRGIEHDRIDGIAMLADGNPESIKGYFGGSIQEGLELTCKDYDTERVQYMSYFLGSFIFGYLCKQWRSGAFDDGSTPTPSDPTPSSDTTVTKPTVSSSSFTYSGSPVTINVPSNIMTVANVTMKKKLPLQFSYNALSRVVQADTKVIARYNPNNKSTTGFEDTFTDVTLSSNYNFKETNAGIYRLTFALKDASTTKWADNSTTPVTIDFTINRATIAAADKPVLNPTDYTYNGQAQTPTCSTNTTANLDKKYVMEAEEATAVNPADEPNYTAFFFPTMNYKWGFTVYSDDPYGFEALPWYIVASGSSSSDSSR